MSLGRGNLYFKVPVVKEMLRTTVNLSIGRR